MNGAAFAAAGLHRNGYRVAFVQIDLVFLCLCNLYKLGNLLQAPELYRILKICCVPKPIQYLFRGIFASTNKHHPITFAYVQNIGA